MRRIRGYANQWLFWFLVLVASGTLMFLVKARLDKAHVALVFLLIVLGGSAAGGRALGVSLSVTAFLAFNWVFLAPYYSLVVADPLDWLVLLAFLVTGVVAAQLLEWRRRETQVAQQRAEEIDQLATLGAETLNAPRAIDALDAIAAVIRSAMGAQRCEIFLRQADGGLRLSDVPGGTPAEAVEGGLVAYTVANAEAAVERIDGTLSLIGDAVTAVRTGIRHPEPLEDLSALAIPLSVRGRIVGALRLSSGNAFDLPDEKRRVLSALSYYAALGVERVRLAEAEEEADALRRADRLKDALLASVSHDLRTPLTAIKGIANELWRGGDPMRAQVIEEEADRLNNLVEDLLELSQINAGELHVTLALNTVDDVVGTALERVEAAHGTRRIEVRIANDGDILVGEFDFAHTMRILTNLLENALKYSPLHSPVTLTVVRRADRLLFAVEDAGAGVPQGDIERIFEPFYRSSSVPDGVRGTGLGLTIARQLAVAQHGTVTYSRREGGGSCFVLDLQASAVPHE